MEHNWTFKTSVATFECAMGSKNVKKKGGGGGMFLDVFCLELGD